MVVVNTDCDMNLNEATHDNSSVNVSMGNETEMRPDRCNGNHIIDLPRLLSAVKVCTTCCSCAEQVVEELFESFICYCDRFVTNIINSPQHRSVWWQFKVFKKGLM